MLNMAGFIILMQICLDGFYKWIMMYTKALELWAWGYLMSVQAPKEAVGSLVGQLEITRNPYG